MLNSKLIWHIPYTCVFCSLQIIQTESGTSIEALLWHNGVLLQAGLDGDLIEYDMNTLRPKVCIVPP